MKWKTWATLCLLCLGCLAPAVAQERRFQEPRDPRASLQRGSSLSSVGRWTDQLANELEHLQEDLYFERGRYPRELTVQAEQALRAATHFQAVLSRTDDPEHLARDFREMDQQVHDLVQRLNRAEDSRMRRQASRIQYADQQLHYLLRSATGEDTGGVREVLARHAHVLENESRTLEQLTERLRTRERREAEVYEAIRDFADEAEHFHEVVEEGADGEPLRNDFRKLDEQWHRVAEQLNASHYGLYVRRSAQRINQVHNQIHDLLGRGRQPERRAEDRHERERPNIEFNIPGIGRFRLR